MNPNHKLRKVKRAGYRNAISALFLVVSPTTIIQKWIVAPILYLLNILAGWASSVEVEEGEQAVHLWTYDKDGKVTIYDVALSRSGGVRILKGYNPEAMLNSFFERFDENQLKNSMALALLPYEEGEEPDEDDDNDTDLMNALLSSAPQSSSDELTALETRINSKG